MEYAKDSKERMPYEHYMEAFQSCNPQEVCDRTGVSYDAENKSFQLKFMGSLYNISYPDYEITHVEDSFAHHPLEEMHSAKILIARYLTEGSKVLSTGKFLTYREMSWGEVYFKQFQGRCLMRLAFGFGNKIDKFAKAMEEMNAVKLDKGDASYELEFLDGMKLQFILWEGDDEFPPSSQILFSDNFAISFSAEDRAAIGDITIGTLKAYQ